MKKFVILFCIIGGLVAAAGISFAQTQGNSNKDLHIKTPIEKNNNNPVVLDTITTSSPANHGIANRKDAAADGLDNDTTTVRGKDMIQIDSRKNPH